MRIIDLYPPMVAGALLAAMWALVTYRIVKRDRPGDESWLQILWFLGSISAVGGYLYLHMNEPAGYVGVVVTTLFSLGLAACMVFVATRVILNKSLPTYPRVFLGCGFVILLAGITVLPNV